MPRPAPRFFWLADQHKCAYHSGIISLLGVKNKSTIGSEIISDGETALAFLHKSADKLRWDSSYGASFAIASLERASDYLDKISDMALLIQLTVPELEKLNSVVDQIIQAAGEILMIASMSMNTSDSGAMGDLEKIQRLSIQVIEKAANAKAMIALAIFAKKLAKGEELFDSKFRPFEPSPIVQKEILEGVQRVLESGDFEKP